MRTTRGYILGSAVTSALVACAGAVAGAPSQSELAAFAQGKNLYQSGQHAQAAQHFAFALEGPSPSIQDPDLVNQARMIWGASAMYLGRLADADLQFERILRNSPKFEPDAILFPPGVLAEFRRIRDKIEKEAAEKKAGDLASKRIAELEAENAKLAKKLKAVGDYAQVEQVVIRRSRIVASIPFGVGQFQNGDPGLGIFFATTESLTLAAAAISYAYHSSLPRDPVDANEARSAAGAARVVNWISLGAFVALAVGGVAQAHVAFVPETWETRTRPLPKGLASLRPFVTSTENHGGMIGFGLAF
jgi:tetratricopeptide (TPR) repeat protein